MHAGHVSYLAGARALGQRLILGLNSDASVTRLKGPTRPINPVEQRAAVLAALACVDAVVVFDEDTPLNLINALQPKVLAKGADYSEDQVVGGKSQILGRQRRPRRPRRGRQHHENRRTQRNPATGSTR